MVKVFSVVLTKLSSSNLRLNPLASESNPEKNTATSYCWLEMMLVAGTSTVAKTLPSPWKFQMKSSKFKVFLTHNHMTDSKIVSWRNEIRNLDRIPLNTILDVEGDDEGIGRIFSSSRHMVIESSKRIVSGDGRCCWISSNLTYCHLDPTSRNCVENRGLIVADGVSTELTDHEGMFSWEIKKSLPDWRRSLALKLGQPCARAIPNNTNKRRNDFMLFLCKILSNLKYCSY